MPHARVFVSRGATAFEIFLRGSLPIEPGPGLISRLWRRIGWSTVFGGPSYPHESAWKNCGFKSHAWIRNLGLFWASFSPEEVFLSLLVSRTVKAAQLMIHTLL